MSGAFAVSAPFSERAIATDLATQIAIRMVTITDARCQHEHFGEIQLQHEYPHVPDADGQSQRNPGARLPSVNRAPSVAELSAGPKLPADPQARASRTRTNSYKAALSCAEAPTALTDGRKEAQRSGELWLPDPGQSGSGAELGRGNRAAGVSGGTGCRAGRA
jgi:hypothetical protein